MKYNIKIIMSKAWEIKRQNSSNDFGLCLRWAWEMAKAPVKGEDHYIAILQKIVDASAQPEGWHLEAIARLWEKNGKSRTYFSIVETRINSKHYVVKEYGYYDNVEKCYVPSRRNNLDVTLYTFSGVKIA